MRNANMKWILGLVAMMVPSCALREKDTAGVEGGEGEGEGIEGEGEGEGEGHLECQPGAQQDCTCPDGRTGFQVCDEQNAWGPCNCGGIEGEGEGEGESEGQPECQPGDSRCTDGMTQICDDAGFWCQPESCPKGQVCTDGSCFPKPEENRTCEVWLSDNMLCGNIVGLFGWTFGCMPPGVEPVCPLQPPAEEPGWPAIAPSDGQSSVCANIPQGVNAAWPRSSDAGWLTVVGCTARDGLRITPDPSGGHYLTLP